MMDQMSDTKVDENVTGGSETNKVVEVDAETKVRLAYFQKVAEKIAMDTEWGEPWQHVINITSEMPLDLIFVECASMEPRKFNSFPIKSEEEQCMLLQRVACAYNKDELIPTYTEEEVCAFEVKHGIELPTLFAFQLLRISKQFLKGHGTDKWIVDLDTALVYSIAVTEEDLANGHIKYVESVESSNCSSKCIRVYADLDMPYFYDLIIDGLGEGMLIKHNDQYCTLSHLCGAVLETKNTIDVHSGEYEPKKRV